VEGEGINLVVSFCEILFEFIEDVEIKIVTVSWTFYNNKDFKAFNFCIKTLKVLS
jgi:hypothetical protein